MIIVRKSNDRGRADFGWLDSRHSFSFGEYYDPKHMGFRSLRVINEDRVAPGKGFGAHPHNNMEIISYVLDGALEHKDSLGTGSVIRPGDVQRMSAGAGITHSEYNHSTSEPVHFLQIWILPERRGIEPGYEQKHFPDAEKLNRLRLIASRDGREGSIAIHQDVGLYASILEPGKSLAHKPDPGRHAWIQVMRGGVTLNSVVLHTGDGAAVSNEPELKIKANDRAEFLLFDLA